MFERTSTRPLFARSSRAPSRPHALPRLLQAVIHASTTVDPTNIPDCRGRPPGRLPASTEGCPTIGGNRRIRSGSGAEKDSEFSALPAVIAHSGDLAPTPTASGHLLSRASPPSPVRSDVGEGNAAITARSCKRRAARGSCGAGLPRRRRAFTNPRCLLPQGCPRCERCAPFSDQPELTERPRLRLFHHRGHRDEGHSHGTR